MSKNNGRNIYSTLSFRNINKLHHLNNSMMMFMHDALDSTWGRPHWCAGTVSELMKDTPSLSPKADAERGKRDKLKRDCWSKIITDLLGTQTDTSGYITNLEPSEPTPAPDNSQHRVTVSRECLMVMLSCINTWKIRILIKLSLVWVLHQFR